jgi:hypothetical protein
MDVDVLHRDFLLAFATVVVKRVEQHRVGARELVGLAQGLTPAFEGLITDHGAPVALHRGIVCGEELSCDHAFQLVSWRNPD